MSLPQAVQAQVDEANRLQAAMSATGAEPQDPPVVPETQEAQQPTQLELPLDQPQQPEPNWEHKYKSEIGRFQAEAARAREAAQQAWQQIEQLRAEHEQLKAQAKPEPEPEAPGVTDRDVETFGSDLVEFAQRAAGKVAAEQSKILRLEIQAIYKALDEMRGQVGQVHSTAQQSIEQTFFDKLVERVPDWQTVNQDQTWIDWLQEADPFAGVPRQVLLNDARAKLDVQRVAQFFEAFKGNSTPSAAQPKPSQSAELQRQVSPPKARAGSSSTPTQGDKKIWHEAEIMKFYEAKALGRLDPQEAARMEADLNQAVAEGRVR